MHSCIYLVKNAVVVTSFVDKAKFYHDLAFRAQACALCSDFSGSCTITRSLCGFSPTPLKAVKKTDGSLTNSEVEGPSRWQEHIASLLHEQIFGFLRHILIHA